MDYVKYDNVLDLISYINDFLPHLNIPDIKIWVTPSTGMDIMKQTALKDGMPTLYY